jgi:hypothetical protein
MLYLWPQSGSMSGFHPNFGVMASPASKMIPLGIEEGRFYGVDNGAYTGAFEPDKFLSYLSLLSPYSGACLFIVVPDVWGSLSATLYSYEEWAETLATYGPLALAAQDGMEDEDWPEGFEWLFIGGTDEWRSGAGPEKCIQRAKRSGKFIHVGRVNSIKRFQHYYNLGADSADGTNAIYEPSVSKRIFTYAVSQLSLYSALPERDSSS